jgi:hypothetical protein
MGAKLKKLSELRAAYTVIELTQNYVAIISTSDFARVKKYSWHAHKSKGNNRKPGAPYARAVIDGKKVYLHRFIMGNPGPDFHVDHDNHQTLDCRRDNLKVLPAVENMKKKRNRKKVEAVKPYDPQEPLTPDWSKVFPNAQDNSPPPGRIPVDIRIGS